MASSYLALGLSVRWRDSDAIDWRATADEFGYVLDDSGSRLALYEPIAADAVTGACAHRNVVGINVGSHLTETANVVTPVASASDWSLMLYTSGTTGRPKGTPATSRGACGGSGARRTKYLSAGEVTRVMPLYHTMGVRSLIAMSLIGGTFVYLRRFDAAQRLRCSNPSE